MNFLIIIHANRSRIQNGEDSSQYR